MNGDSEPRVEAQAPAAAAEGTVTYDMLAVPGDWGGYASEAAFQAGVRQTLGHLLGHDPENPNAEGSRLWFRRREGNPGVVFVTTDPAEEPTFPKSHPRFPTRDRHRWSAGPGGVRLGALNDTARAERQARLALVRRNEP